jgi:hypothetical protein
MLRRLLTNVGWFKFYSNTTSDPRFDIYEWFGASLSADARSILQIFKPSIPILAHLFKSKNLKGLVGKSSLAPYRHYTLSKPKDHSLHALK